MPSASPSAAPPVTYAPSRAVPAAADPGRAAGVLFGGGPPAPAGAPAPAPSDALYHALVDALRTERRLVDDLAGTMRRQRAAVAGDDLATVDDTVFATHRVLATLGQARLRRRQLNRLFAGADEVPLRRLAEAACAHAARRGERAGAAVAADAAARADALCDEVRGACDALAAGAAALAREVDVNRRVLRDALAAGERHVRALVGPAAAGGGGVVDRTA